MRKLALVVALLSIQCDVVVVATQIDNSELTALDVADQGERKAKDIDWGQVLRHDIERSAAVRRIMQDGGIKTAADYSHAAEVLIHGNSLENFQLSYALARIGSELAPGDTKLKMLSADAWDRILVTKSRPQWYGTQFQRNADGVWSLEPFDKDVFTDGERVTFGGLTIKQINDRLAQYKAEDSLAPKRESPTGEVPMLKGGDLKFSEDKDAELILAKQNPALGLFWYRLVQIGAPDIIDTHQKLRSGFANAPYQDVADVINGSRPGDSLRSEFLATFIEFSMSSNMQKQVVIDVNLDDKVVPEATLKFNFYRHFQIIAERDQTGSDGQLVKFISAAAIAN